jgi:hypothetical protein
MYEPNERDDSTIATALAALVLVGAILAVAAVGTVGAADVEVHNSTVTVDADTDTAWAELNNTNSSAAANATVTFYGVENASGNATETQISTHSPQVGSSSDQLVESSAVNGTKYDEVRILVEVDNSTVPADDVTVTTGTFQKVSGGSGSGGLGGTGLGVGAVIVIVGALVSASVTAAEPIALSKSSRSAIVSVSAVAVPE